MNTKVSYAGLNGGHLESGRIFRHEVREFVASCVASGWTSVSVTEVEHARPGGIRHLAVFTPSGLWFRDEAAA